MLEIERADSRRCARASESLLQWLSAAGVRSKSWIKNYEPHSTTEAILHEQSYVVNFLFNLFQLITYKLF